MKKLGISLLTLTICAACAQAGRTGVINKNSPGSSSATTLANSKDGFFGTQDLTESVSSSSATVAAATPPKSTSTPRPTTKTIPRNRQFTRQNTSNPSTATCLSLGKLATFLRSNPDEPLMIYTYDLALGSFTKNGNFQNSGNDDLESNTLLTGDHPAKLPFSALHVSEMFSTSPKVQTLDPNDPTTLFNFGDQNACKSIATADGKASVAIGTNFTSKTATIAVDDATYIYTLGNNSVQVSVFQTIPVTACGTNLKMQIKNTYMFSFQKDMQNVRVAKNLYGLIINHIPAIQAQIKGMRTGTIPTSSYILAGEDIAATPSLAQTTACSGATPVPKAK